MTINSDETLNNFGIIPVIAVSACLMGDKVRFDGGHKLHKFVSEKINPYFRFVKICPEIEVGMGVPRPPIHLYKSNSGDIKLVNRDNHSLDYTKKMIEVTNHRSSQLGGEISGLILKSKSPSCGMSRVPIYRDEHETPDYSGVGMFAKNFMERCPLLPVEEEGRLNDPTLRENFFERVYAYCRWKQIDTSNPKELINFHTSYKYSLMARGPTFPSQLGRIVAGVTKHNAEEKSQSYIELFMTTMAKKATRAKHVNAMQHVMGYFKKELEKEDKDELLKTMNSYKNCEVPLSTPMALIRLYQRKHKNKYIEGQWYLNPYPESLALRANI
jgi:uncharacterized protein YbgA (DUF1722 family)/uncharacterized protein YbbK (DUF523 family)